MMDASAPTLKPLRRKAACQRPPRGTPADILAAAHRTEMKLRRARQLARTPGFTPVVPAGAAA